MPDLIFKIEPGKRLSVQSQQTVRTCLKHVHS